jgi:hypothetical protein
VGEDRTSDSSRTEQDLRTRRVTVAEAADILGIAAEAVRTRIKRGKLESVKDPPLPGGTVYVLLEADQTRPKADLTSQGQDQTTDQTGPALLEAKDETIAELRARVDSLERSLSEEREARRRADTIIAQLTSRIPEIEAPSDPRESPAEAASGAPSAKPRWWRSSGGHRAPLVAEGVRRRLGVWTRCSR